jgi:dephospho-CoA kinase
MKQNQTTRSQRRIGLTGGIATGKSTVAHYLKNLKNHDQLPILDADLFAREAVEPGSAILQRITQRYGSQIRQADGRLDRAQLGQIVFAKESERRWLEAQIHPYVGQCFDRELQKLQTYPTVVLVIPLLFEANLTHRVTETWVVSCTPEQQLRRLMQRNQLTELEARSRIAAQMPLAEKCARADVVLDNSGDLATLYREIELALSSGS